MCLCLFKTQSPFKIANSNSFHYFFDKAKTGGGVHEYPHASLRQHMAESRVEPQSLTQLTPLVDRLVFPRGSSCGPLIPLQGALQRIHKLLVIVLKGVHLFEDLHFLVFPDLSWMIRSFGRWTFM